MSKVVITRSEVREFTHRACLENGLSEEFFRGFWERMLTRDDIYKEYVMYLAKKEFVSEVEIEGYHVVDIMIWQMDHFKAQLDMDTYAQKHNEAYMILTAFDTFLKMAEDPEEYVQRMQIDTGTDYPDKFFDKRK
ncbi:MAG: hypothetical protein K6G07_05355 [Lachnospiraceae bacterium]|nr:hypothetical protein [Lachnospiraceae bacterium]